MYKALREGELAVTVPVMSLLPALNALTSFVMIGELPTGLGVFGIILIIIGIFILLRSDKKSKVTNDKADSETKTNTNNGVAVMYMIFAVFCMAIGSTLDKISISYSTPIFYAFMNCFGAALILLLLVFKEGKQKKLLL